MIHTRTELTRCSYAHKIVKTTLKPVDGSIESKQKHQKSAYHILTSRSSDIISVVAVT